METKYQRIGREQAERQAARAKRMQAELNAKSKSIRASRLPRRHSNFEGSDFDYSMNQ